MRRIFLLAAVGALLAGALASCTGETGTSDLYLLEELEAARSVDDPDARIERLEIYAANNEGHPYCSLAHEKILETMAVEKCDIEGALEYFDSLMAREEDRAARGKLIFSKFEIFWETDSLQAVSLAKEVLESGESDFRLLMYMAYYLMGAEGHEDVAGALFERLIGITGEGVRNGHARTIYAEFLEKEGRGGEAAEQLRLALPYTFANEPIGRALWEEGRREEALDAYIRLAAGAPLYREYIKLDSLYALVHPSPSDLDSRIAALRVEDGPELPDMQFVDIRGMRHSISGYRGRKIVITAFSPT